MKKLAPFLALLILPALAMAGPFFRRAVPSSGCWGQAPAPAVAGPEKKPSVIPFPVVQAPEKTKPVYSWHGIGAPVSRWELYEGEKYLGEWNPKIKRFYGADLLWYNAVPFASAPPLPPEPESPFRLKPEPREHKDGQEGILTGVAWDKLSQVEKYQLNTCEGAKEVSLGTVYSAIKKSLNCQGIKFGDWESVPDDSTKPHLTGIFKDAAKRKKFESDLKTPALSLLASTYRVQVYDPELPASKLMLAPFKLEQDERYQAGGVAIYLQPPEKNGKAPIEAALYAYQGPESLRTVDPAFDPNRNPDPNKRPAPPAPAPGPSSPPPAEDFSWVYWLLGFLGLGWLANKNRPQPSPQRI